MNKTVFFLALGLVRLAQSETVVDVSHEWKAHQSTSTVILPTQGPSTVPTRAPAATGSTDTNTCVCENLTTPEKLEAATYAFTGMVIGVSAPKNHRREIAFDVDEIFKGDPKQEMEVTEELAGTDCDLSVSEGQNYLVYTRWNWGTDFTSRCMGTKLLEPSGVQALGPSQSMKEKLYSHLRNACMGRTDTACCLESLKAMRLNYHTPEPEQGCPGGTIPDRISCNGSYTWCISPNEKSHRKAP